VCVCARSLHLRRIVVTLPVSGPLVLLSWPHPFILDKAHRNPVDGLQLERAPEELAAVCVRCFRHPRMMAGRGGWSPSRVVNLVDPAESLRRDTLAGRFVHDNAAGEGGSRMSSGGSVNHVRIHGAVPAVKGGETPDSPFA